MEGARTVNKFSMNVGRVANNELQQFTASGQVNIHGGVAELDQTLTWSGPQLRRLRVARVDVQLVLRKRRGTLSVRCTNADNLADNLTAELSAVNVAELLESNGVAALPRLLFTNGVHLGTVRTCVLVADLDAAVHKVSGPLTELIEQFRRTAALLGQL